MFGKFFASAFTGSMMSAGANVFAVWGYVIANAVGSRVELNPKLIGVLIGMDQGEVVTAIEYLCATDGNSRSKLHDGRRLIREGEFQFFVPNHEHYRNIRDEEGRREYNRLKQQEYRQKLRENVKPPVNDSQSLLPKSNLCTQAEAEAEAEAEAVNLESLRDSSSPRAARTIPPCPVQRILDAYHRILPTLNQVAAMNDNRRKMLQTRWRELHDAGDFETQDAGVQTFERYFELVKESTFLLGKANGIPGRRPFVADFEWLIRPQNFLKVIERKYHGTA